MADRRKSRRRPARGSLALIGALLLSSAALRLVTGPGPAVAQAIGGGLANQAETAAPEPMAAAGQNARLDRPEISALLNELQRREAQIKERELQLDMRSKALDVASEEITRRLDLLAQTEENLRRTLALADGAAEDDLARLTAVYENMKPKEAAALFATMEPDFAAGFLGRMRPDAAASVMAGLPPDVAYSISVILAGRNANAPKS